MTNSQKEKLSKSLSSAINFHEITGPFLSRCRVQADLSILDMWSIIRTNEKFIDFKVRPYTISDELTDDTFVFGPPPTSYTRHSIANGNTLTIDGHLFLYPHTQSSFVIYNNYYFNTISFGISYTNGDWQTTESCQQVNTWLNSNSCPSYSIPTATYEPGCVNQKMVCIPWCNYNVISKMTLEVRQLVNNRCVTYAISKYGVSIISDLNTTFIGVIDKEISTLVQVTGTLLLPVSQGRRCSTLSDFHFNVTTLRVVGVVDNKCSDELCSITSPYTESYSFINYDKTKISIPVLQNYTGDVQFSYCCGSDCQKYSTNIYHNISGGIEYMSISSAFVSGVYAPFKAKNYVDAFKGIYNFMPEKRKVLMWFGVCLGIIALIIIIILLYYILRVCYIPSKILVKKAHSLYGSLLKENKKPTDNEQILKRLKYE
jgi:hypothetical protein